MVVVTIYTIQLLKLWKQFFIFSYFLSIFVGYEEVFEFYNSENFPVIKYDKIFQNQKDYPSRLWLQSPPVVIMLYPTVSI